MAQAAKTSLKTYRKKRDFSRTPEPKGRAKAGARKGRAFVVQKHAARRLHYDFRLEHDGVLLSWAVTRGPSLDPADKRLAVRTEDHPLDYGAFEGVIPPGEYGAGTVMIWDEGTWQPEGEVDEGLERGVLKFRLDGQRLKGGWALVRMNREGRGRSARENWLLIKERDSEARRDGMDLLSEAITSVLSGLGMEEIPGSGRVWTGGDSDRATGKRRARSGARQPAPRVSTLQGRSRRKAEKGGQAGGRARVPGFVAPQLATLVDSPPEGEDWLHEIKFDGYRVLAAIAGGSVVLRTRKGLDWTERFQALVPTLQRLDCASVQLDGEVAVADAAGRTDFGALQNALSAGGAGIAYYVFDLLSLDGEDWRARPQIERKERLKALIARLPKAGPVIYSDHMPGLGGQVFDKACEIGLEGIVSKRRDAPYRLGRTKAWLKVKCGLGQEFVIVGWRPSDKRGRPFSSLLLAAHEGGALRYVGRVGSGFGERDLAELARALKRLAVKTPRAEGVPAAVRRRARFVKPELVAEIAFRGWTREGLIRQGSFKGLRTDKPTRAIVRETAMAPPKSGPEPSRGASGTDTIEGVRVTNPDRVLYPGQGVTKRALIDYYLAVAGRMLPYMEQRPLSLVRCPEGRQGECFYQKHASAGFPAALKRVTIEESSGKGEYLYIDDAAGLVAAVQMGVLELHVWGARTDRLDRPDRLVFDLDPDTELLFDKVKAAAREMRERLKELGLQAFPLATGGKGLHLVVPLTRQHDWQAHKDFAHALAGAMAADSPDLYTVNMSKRARKGKVFIDYLRNDRGATAIAPFSARAREGAPIAFPLSWNGLGKLKDARPASVTDAPGRLFRQNKDPWEGYFGLRQALPPTMPRN